LTFWGGLLPDAPESISRTISSNVVGLREPALKSTLKLAFSSLTRAVFAPVYSIIALVTLKEGLGQLNVPSKNYSIMAGARPVLAAVPKDSEIHRLIQDADCGYWVPPEDPRALAEAILDLKNQPDRLKRYGRNGRHYVAEHYSRQNQTNKYYELLHKAI
jgi:glycosyltransferase involved in cell wall biosynthesis